VFTFLLSSLHLFIYNFHLVLSSLLCIVLYIGGWHKNRKIEGHARATPIWSAAPEYLVTPIVDQRSLSKWWQIFNISSPLCFRRYINFFVPILYKNGWHSSLLISKNCPCAAQYFSCYKKKSTWECHDGGVRDSVVTWDLVGLFVGLFFSRRSLGWWKCLD